MGQNDMMNADFIEDMSYNGAWQSRSWTLYVVKFTCSCTSKRTSCTTVAERQNVMHDKFDLLFIPLPSRPLEPLTFPLPCLPFVMCIRMPMGRPTERWVLEPGYGVFRHHVRNKPPASKVSQTSGNQSVNKG